jgi:hypothetical protein
MGRVKQQIVWGKIVGKGLFYWEFIVIELFGGFLKNKRKNQIIAVS